MVHIRARVVNWCSPYIPKELARTWVPGGRVSVSGGDVSVLLGGIMDIFYDRAASF